MCHQPLYVSVSSLLTVPGYELSSSSHSHSAASLSPDLRNMVSVGDSDEVYLFEVVDGGREFRKVATYKGMPVFSVLALHSGRC